jgi:hypothetical protein
MCDQWTCSVLRLDLPRERVGVSGSMLRVGRAAERDAAALMEAREVVLPDLDSRVRVPPVLEEEMPEDIPVPEEPEAADMVEGLWVKIVFWGKVF